MSIAAKLQKLRNSKNWSQMDVALQLDISQAAYNKWESGKANPTMENLKKISEIFEVDFYGLLNEMIPFVDLSNAQFEGHSYVVNPVSSTINFQSQELANEIIKRQEQITETIQNQNFLIEKLVSLLSEKK